MPADRTIPATEAREALRERLVGALASLAYVVWGPGRGFDQPEGRSPDGVTWAVPSKVRALLDEAAALPDSGERPGLPNTETWDALTGLLIAVDNAALSALADAEDGAEEPEWQTRLWDAADEARAVRDRVQVGTLVALATPARDAQPAEERLDMAWAAAEAALPDGWDLMVGHTSECRYCPGWWATASKRLKDPPHYPQVVSSETGRPRGEHHDPTPAAALRALVIALARQADRGPDHAP
jgi:hypothetical protein